MTQQLQLGMGRHEPYGTWQGEPGRIEIIEERILRALGSKAWGERDKEILRVIAGQKGAGNAVRAAEIARRLGFQWNEQTRRDITRVVETAVEFYRIPIGGLREKPYGYFVVVTRADLELAIRPLEAEFYALLRRIRALTSKQDVARIFGQAMLKLDREAA